MAKESMKAREVKRAKMVAKYAEKRVALKKIINTTDDPAQAYTEESETMPENGLTEETLPEGEITEEVLPEGETEGAEELLDEPEVSPGL